MNSEDVVVAMTGLRRPDGLDVVGLVYHILLLQAMPDQRYEAQDSRYAQTTGEQRGCLLFAS